MALLNAGYWQSTYWAENYWAPKYWPKYGYVAPSVEAATYGSPAPRPEFPPYLMKLIRDYVAVEEAAA